MQNIGGHTNSRHIHKHKAILPILHKMGMNFIKPLIEFIYIHFRHFVELVDERMMYPLSLFVIRDNIL